MSGFARLLAAACMAAALTASAACGSPPAPSIPSASSVASLHESDRLAASRVLLRRRDCSKWWTCGPFKRDKPRLA